MWALLKDLSKVAWKVQQMAAQRAEKKAVQSDKRPDSSTVGKWETQSAAHSAAWKGDYSVPQMVVPKASSMESTKAAPRAAWTVDILAVSTAVRWAYWKAHRKVVALATQTVH